jgi:acyl carrier protein
MVSEEQLKQILAMLLDADEDELTGDTLLADLARWDSVNALRVLNYLERQTDGAIDYDRFMAALSVRDLSAAING